MYAFAMMLSIEVLLTISFPSIKVVRGRFLKGASAKVGRGFNLVLDEPEFVHRRPHVTSGKAIAETLASMWNDIEDLSDVGGGGQAVTSNILNVTSQIFMNASA